MFIIGVKTQTRFMVLFTSRSLLTWRKSLDASPSISPRYLPAIYPKLTISPSLLQIHTMGEYAFFLQKADWCRKDMALMGGTSTFAFAALVSTSLSFPGRTVPPEWP